MIAEKAQISAQGKQKSSEFRKWSVWRSKFPGGRPKATLILPYSACTLQRKQVSLVVSTETQS